MAEDAAEAATQETYKLTVKGVGVTIDKKIDANVARAVVTLVMGGEPLSASPQDDGGGGGAKTRRPKRSKGEKGKGKGRSGKAKRAASVGIDKNLSLRPKGKQSFKEFAEEKAPADHYDKTVVAVYWLTEVASAKASAQAVNTCYQGADWKRPTDLRNTLQQTASKKGWLDTADSDEIKLTVPGEDYVRHDLPKSSKKK
jgi:hypothetical protein